MNNFSKKVKQVQKFVDSNTFFNAEHVESAAREKFGEMFVPIALDYYETRGLEYYDEMNDVEDFDNLLDELGLGE